MGLDVRNFIVYGIPVAKQDLMVTTKDRGCDHEVSDSQNFCSICGKPVWIFSTETIFTEPNYGNFTPSYDAFEQAHNCDKFLLGFILEKSDSHRSSSYNIGQGTFYQTISDPAPHMKPEIENFCIQHNIPFNAASLQNYQFLHFSY
jgi:hypothetical protein